MPVRKQPHSEPILGTHAALLSLVSVSEHEFHGDVPDVTANQDWNCAMLKGTFGNTGSNLEVLPMPIGEG
jgi:hypothetical protein